MGTLAIGLMKPISFIQDKELENTPESGYFNGGRTLDQML